MRHPGAGGTMRRTYALAIIWISLSCKSGVDAPPAVATVTISPAGGTVEVGSTLQLSASPRSSDGSALTNPVAWSSSATSVATVNATGTVTGVSVGAATITAESGGKQGTVSVSVTPPAVATIAVSLSATSVELGRTSQATAVLRDRANNVLSGRTVTWTSSSPATASVSGSGLITALAVGTTSVTATSEGMSGAATLTVIPRPVNTVTVTLAPASLVSGTNGQATFVARDVDNNVLTGRAAAWSSSNPQVATVNATSGVVTAVAVGQANIVATVETKSGSALLTVTPVIGFGTVTGVVTAANGVTPIGDALVDVETAPGLASFARASAPPSTRTAADGTYSLSNVPSGPQVLVITRGAFQAKVNVFVQTNQAVAAPKAVLKSTGKLAFVRGAFDSIEDIVRDVLGNPIEEIQASQLASSAVTSAYRMIFLNCGLDTDPVFDNPAVVTNLRAFLQNGGTIYASDWAAEYVNKLFPAFTFELTGDEQSTTGTIVDASLQTFVGKTAVAIVYDLDSWANLLTVPANATVLVRASYTAGGVQQTNQPIAISIPQGSGRLVFTTFHNEAGATADQVAVLRHFIYIP